MWGAATIVGKFFIREVVFSLATEHAIKVVKRRLKKKPTKEEMSCSYEHLQMDEEGDKK